MLNLQSDSAEENPALEKEEGEEEQRSKGSVGSHVYKSYAKATGPWFLLASMFLLSIVSQLLASGSDYWTTYWYTIFFLNIFAQPFILVALNKMMLCSFA